MRQVHCLLWCPLFGVYMGQIPVGRLVPNLDDLRCRLSGLKIPGITYYPSHYPESFDNLN